MKFLDKVKLAGEILLATAKQSDKFPPLLLCPVCQRRTRWIEQGRRWGCVAGHFFTVTLGSSEPLPRLPGDAGDNKGEI